MTRRVLWLLLGVVVLPFACNQSIDDHISCHEDGHCPSNYFCKSVGYCASFEKGGPADVQLIGVTLTDDGEPAPSIHVRLENSYQRFYLVLKNVGGEQADPEIRIDGPRCLGMNGKLGSNATGYMDPGQVVHVAVYPTIEKNCPTPAIVNVTIKEGGGSVSPLRMTYGSFSVVLQ